MSNTPALAAAVVVAGGLLIGASTVAAAEIGGAATATAQAKRISNQEPTEEPPPPPAPDPEPQSVQYRVTVISDWTDASHPTTLPGNSHFSPVVVATHEDVGDLFVRGAVASPGMETMAETGGTSTLVGEASADATVTSVNVGSSIFGAGETAFTVTLTQSAPRVSAVTMLAPSPDWFVGVRDVSMFSNGEWIDRVERDLANYDAGTDSGTSWTSSDNDTNPAEAISGPRETDFSAAAAEGRFGRIIIERI